mmetsp:Transcript_37183/g.89720  ORF Transcript_37183/g.89720 Transcript_37183/m.89720 type:complete len:278 (-) Transcript_37183:484-1317(-)
MSIPLGVRELRHVGCRRLLLLHRRAVVVVVAGFSYHGRHAAFAPSATVLRRRLYGHATPGLVRVLDPHGQFVKRLQRRRRPSWQPRRGAQRPLIVVRIALARRDRYDPFRIAAPAIAAHADAARRIGRRRERIRVPPTNAIVVVVVVDHGIPRIGILSLRARALQVQHRGGGAGGSSGSGEGTEGASRHGQDAPVDIAAGGGLRMFAFAATSRGCVFGANGGGRGGCRAAAADAPPPLQLRLRQFLFGRRRRRSVVRGFLLSAAPHPLFAPLGYRPL